MQKAMMDGLEDSRPQIGSATYRHAKLLKFAIVKRCADNPCWAFKMEMEVTKGVHAAVKEFWEGSLHQGRKTRIHTSGDASCSIGRWTMHRLLCSHSSMSLHGSLVALMELDDAQWHNCQIGLGAGDHVGCFDFATDFVLLKKGQPFDATFGLKGNKRKLKQYTRQPKSVDNILFSLALRSLALMLRRGIIEGIDTFNQLLTPSTSAPGKISIKTDWPNQPVS
ncbi:hypothetical protein OCU04_008703 [Sclerotinia nivalis]|uniref:Uncharacterized protein n=1 Tax=Sclerotinia nivalis TaxID=352851 RepID=A0A9X0AJK1_9HELO|nr:hypothetical protein OCU04_008703 [Sclerotinia nivalis]